MWFISFETNEFECLHNEKRQRKGRMMKHKLENSAIRKTYGEQK